MNEKDLRGITIDGNDLLNCLTKKESEDYHREEGKGKQLYHKARVIYKSKTGRRGKVRQWTPKEIQMHLNEELNNCKTATEMILLLFKIEDEISATSVKDLLKDHPQKPGGRGLAQAIQRINRKMGHTLRKRQVGREIFYSFVRDEYKDIDLKNLYACYHGKVSWNDIKPVLEDDEPIGLLEMAIRVENLIECNAGLERRLHKMEGSQKEGVILEASSQRLDVHFYLHFGKED